MSRVALGISGSSTTLGAAVAAGQFGEGK